jgi:hypothetical protein
MSLEQDVTGILEADIFKPASRPEIIKRKGIDTKLIGSGKLPNKYYVTNSNDYYVMKKPGQLDWASEHGMIKKFKDFPEQMRAFNTYDEAIDYVQSLELPETPAENTMNSIFIEDHITGELFHYYILARPNKLPYNFSIESTEYIGFTKKTMEEAGYTFERVNEEIFKPASKEEVAQRLKDAPFSIEKWAEKYNSAILVYGVHYPKLVKRISDLYTRGAKFRVLGFDQDEIPPEKVEQAIQNNQSLGWKLLHYENNYSSGEWIFYKETITEDLFKAATPKDLEKRKSDYIKALGPKFKQLQDLVPEIRRLEEDYKSYAEQGHYSKAEYNDFPTHVSFNIKLSGGGMPEKARKFIEKHGLEDRSDSYYWYEVNNQLSLFGDDLVNTYDFIEKWYQEGRSGGWLVLELSPLEYQNYAEEIMELIIDPTSADVNHLEHELDNGHSLLTKYIKELRKRVIGLGKIENSIAKGVRDVEKHIESEEFWNQFIEDINL